MVYFNMLLMILLNAAGNPYLFTDFQEGIVKLKSGQVEKAMVNYNVFDQSMEYLINDKPLTITNPLDIDTIKVDKINFIPVGEKFYILLSKDPVALLVSVHAKEKRLVGATDHLETGRKDQNSSFDVVSDVYTSGRYGKKDPEFVNVLNYWLLNGKSIYKANTEKQIAKVFSDKADAIHDFIKENNIDLNNQEDIVKLIAFANQ